MDFGKVLEDLRRGHIAHRSGWNGRGMRIELQVPDEHSRMTQPYIFMWTADANRVPWVASQTDLLATDWETEI